MTRLSLAEWAELAHRVGFALDALFDALSCLSTAAPNAVLMTWAVDDFERADTFAAGAAELAASYELRAALAAVKVWTIGGAP